jgi:DNA-binding response OmpR family regulator
MRLLLIEDDKFFRQFYALKFRERNIEVDEAGDGEEGLTKVKENIPDLILLDLIMPRKDGFEFLDSLEKLNLLNKIPVLVFSTLGQEKDIQRAKDLGAKGYINKSFFDFDRLFSRIMELSGK